MIFQKGCRFPIRISKNDPGCPQSREVQDKQFKDAVKEIEKQYGKKLRIPRQGKEVTGHLKMKKVEKNSGMMRESLGQQAIKLTIIIIALTQMRQAGMMNIWMEKGSQQEIKVIHPMFILQREYGGNKGPSNNKMNRLRVSELPRFE